MQKAQGNLKTRLHPIAGVPDAQLGFAVVACRHKGEWLLCRHRRRDTWEIPGGTREAGEAIEATARRELYEETGAVAYTLKPVCGYSVEGDVTTHGLLYFAEVEALGPLPASEIEEVKHFAGMPDGLTYPQIQPLLFAFVQRWLQGETLSGNG